MSASIAPRSARWLALLALVCVVAGGVIVYLGRTVAEQNRRLAARDAQNRQLTERLRAVQEAGSPQQAATPDSPAAIQAPGVRRSHGKTTESRGEDETLPLRESLTEANATVARLEGRITELEAQLERVSAESKQSTAVVEGLNQSLAEATRTVESLQKDTRNQSRQLAELESSNKRLREQSTQSTGTNAELLKLSAELQDLNRRRDTYVGSILRRYKDITDQYRALSVALDARRERQSAPLGEAEISRIQNTIAMTEEDLRQINALNAQAARILKKIPQP